MKKPTRKSDKYLSTFDPNENFPLQVQGIK